MKFLIAVLGIAALLLLSCNSAKQKTKVQSEDGNAVPAYNHARMQSVDLSKSISGLLCQQWEYKDDIDYAADEESENLDMPYSGYVFFADGTVVKNPRHFYLPGKWMLDSTNKPILIRIELANGTKENYKLAKVNTTELLLVQNDLDGIKQTFTGSGLVYKAPDNDPFHPSNNAWRTAPTKKESDADLKKRLHGCVHFFNLYYQYCTDANLQLVSFAGIPTCFRWYAGGIYLKPKDKLPQSWYRCFYNNAQANQTWQMASDLLSVKFTWPKRETNWVKQNLFVLKQMDSVLAIN